MKIMLLQIIAHRFQTTKVVCLVKIYTGQLPLICESVAIFIRYVFFLPEIKQEYQK